ncbi:DUF6249 domain-containing protein [Balneicella halophila]|uniref:DUF6249 domain-containing protein n=1 Tax=Balneicella halophila TaxID=1537566 RepID=UPI000E2FFFC0|nr:DUF6249 domain-containing protein [Balneicella halophila]
MEVFLVFLGIATIVGVSKYFSYKKQLLDRVALNPDDVKLVGQMNMGNEALRFGLLFIGIALGIIIGAILTKLNLFNDELFAYLTGIFLCGGLGLVVGYLLESKKKDKNSPNE